jgi:hypothetical protein
MTRWTAIALQKKAGRKSTKVALGITMPPETIMAASGTSTWAYPGIILA